MKFNRVRLWKDPGFTEEGTIQPNVRAMLSEDNTKESDLGNADYDIGDFANLVYPEKGREFSMLKAQIAGAHAFELNYICVTVFAPELLPSEFEYDVYGWVDRVERVATGQDVFMIYWHIDYWRTYIDKVRIPAGHGIRLAVDDYARPAAVEPVRWVLNKAQAIFKTDAANDYLYVVVMYNHTDNGISTIRTLSWRASYIFGETIDIGGVTYRSPSLGDIYAGKLDELLGLDPAAIIGAWVVPVRPFYITSPSPNNVITNEVGGNKYFAFIKPAGLTSTEIGTLDKEYVSDDTRRTVVLDPDGNIVYVLPWGHSIQSWSAIADVGSVGANFLMRWEGGGAGLTSLEHWVQNSMQGKNWTLVGKELPVNSNAWSSYRYSGQRDLDIEKVKISTMESLGNVGNSAISGALTGALVGAAGGPIGAAAGLGIGAVAGAVGVGISYAANNTLQGQIDRQMKRSSSQILLSGGGDQWIKGGFKNWMIAEFVMDDKSLEAYEGMIARCGYPSEYEGDIDDVLVDDGGYQVINAEVSGPVPPEAIKWIRKKLADGVTLKHTAVE